MTKETLHPEDIKYIIKKHGVNLSDLARATGLAPSTVRNALRYPLFAGEQAIAQFLNVHPMILWPSRYDSNGKPLHPHASASKEGWKFRCRSKVGGGREYSVESLPEDVKEYILTTQIGNSQQIITEEQNQLVQNQAIDNAICLNEHGQDEAIKELRKQCVTDFPFLQDLFNE